jgi:hypothetical protein
MRDALHRGSAISISYRTDYDDSGHYHTVVQYDEYKKAFIVYDSWKGNKHCRNGGVKEEYDDSFYLARARPRFIEIARPA